MKIGGSGNNQAGFSVFLVAKLMCAPRRGRDAGRHAVAVASESIALGLSV